MDIRKADIKEFSEIRDIYASARAFMSENGNAEQWKGGYPSDSLIKSDIERENLYVCMDGEEIAGVFYFAKENDPSYEKIYEGEWLNDNEYAVIHRVAVAKQGRGVSAFCFDYCYNAFPNLKIDTHKDNIPMQKALAKNGFARCGKIYLDNGEERIAYQKAKNCCKI